MNERQYRITVSGDRETREAFLAFLRSQARGANEAGLEVSISRCEERSEHPVEFERGGNYE